MVGADIDRVVVDKVLRVAAQVVRDLVAARVAVGVAGEGHCGQGAVAGRGEEGEAVVVGRPRANGFCPSFQYHRIAPGVAQAAGGGQRGLPTADDESVYFGHECCQSSDGIRGVPARESRAAANVAAPNRTNMVE